MQYSQISDSDIEQQVLSFMAELGVNPASYESLKLDGQIHRYDIEGDKRGSNNGAYIIHTDGIPAGFIQDWKRGVKATWKYESTAITEEQKAYFTSPEYKAKQKAERQRKEEERKKRQLDAIDNVRRRMRTLPEAPGNFPYLKKKHIYPYGVKLDSNGKEDMLAVPLRDIDGNVCSLQWIFSNGQKRFYSDAPIESLFWSIALDTLKTDTKEVILLGEGYATMAKIHELTNIPCVAALSCHALKAVAKRLKERYPECKIYVTADNDKSTEIKRDFNPGVQAAKELVKLGLAECVIIPEFEKPEDGTDWDDYALLYGDEECSRKVKQEITDAPLRAKQAKYLEQAKQLGCVSYEIFTSFCQPVERPAWLIEDWIPSESLIMLFAPSGSGKSFVASDIAYSIANPNMTHWHDKKILKHGAVVYIAAEGQRGMRKRFAGIVYHYGVSTDGLKMAVIKEPLIIDEKDAKVGVLKAIANIGSIYPNPVMVLFDTMSGNMCGDENKTVDAINYTHACKQIIQELGCSVMLIHHTGLNPEAQGRARGSSVLKATMDIEMRVEKNERIITLQMTKSKDTEIPPDIVFNLETIEVPGFFKSTGELETTCIIEKIEGVITANSKKAKSKVSKAESFAKDTYQETARKFGILIEDDSRQLEVVAVKLEDWREVFSSMSSADNSDTKRKQFQRARAILLEEKHILFKKEIAGQEYYCVEPSGDAYESAMMLCIRRKNDDKRYQD